MYIDEQRHKLCTNYIVQLVCCIPFHNAAFFFCSSSILDTIPLLAFITRLSNNIALVVFVCALDVPLSLSLYLCRVVLFFFSQIFARLVSFLLSRLNGCMFVGWFSLYLHSIHSHTLFIIILLFMSLLLLLWLLMLMLLPLPLPLPLRPLLSDKNTIISHKSVLTLSRNTQIYFIHTHRSDTCGKQTTSEFFSAFIRFAVCLFLCSSFRF